MREMGIPRAHHPEPSRPVLGLRLHHDQCPRRPPAHDAAHQPAASTRRARREVMDDAGARGRGRAADAGLHRGHRGRTARSRCAISARTTSWSCRSAATTLDDGDDGAAVAGLPRGPRGALRLQHPGRDHRDRQLHGDRVSRTAKPDCQRWRPAAGRPSRSATSAGPLRRRAATTRRCSGATRCAPATRIAGPAVDRGSGLGHRSSNPGQRLTVDPYGHLLHRRGPAPEGGADRCAFPRTATTSRST